MTPVIIEAAINGITAAARNPNAPRTPRAIAKDALACIAQGASIIHNHIDDLKTSGQAAADRYAEGWAQILARHPDAILCPTGVVAPTSAEQLAHFTPCARAGAAMAPLDPGSVNICDTDEQGRPGAMRFAYVNDFDHIEQCMTQLHRSGLAPSIAIYEPSFLRAVLAYHRAGMLPPGTLLKFYFGGDHDLLGQAPHRDAGPRAVSFGLPPTPTALDAYLEMLGDVRLPWAVACLGGNICAGDIALHALKRGGHLRVGLEDYGGGRQPTNVELLKEALALCARAGRRPASFTETAALLGLTVPAMKRDSASHSPASAISSQQ